MKIICQRNPLWSAVKLGQSNCSVYQYGCTTSSISSFSDWYGEFKDPGTLAKSLQYTTSGLLIWSSIGNVFKTFQFKWRFYSFDKKLIDNAIKSKDDVVLLNVDRGYHWVAAIRPIPFTNSYWVMDPWSGKNRIYSGIVGGVLLTRK